MNTCIYYYIVYTYSYMHGIHGCTQYTYTPKLLRYNVHSVIYKHWYVGFLNLYLVSAEKDNMDTIHIVNVKKPNEVVILTSLTSMHII